MGGRTCREVSMCSVLVFRVELSTVSRHPSSCAVDSAMDEVAVYPHRPGE